MENTSLRRTQRLVTWVALPLIAFAFMVAIASLFVTVTRTTLYDPFGEFPVQEVLNRVRGQDAPAVVVGDNVLVVGTKCYDEEVEVRGDINWKLVSPVVAVIPAGSGVANRLPGCERLEFSNAWPPAADALTRRLLADGQEVVWVIEGHETPTQGGTTQTWSTQSFSVVPGGE